MHLPTSLLAFGGALLFSTLSGAAPVSMTCTKSARLAGAEQIPYAYNLVAPGASAAAFEQVPFAENCTTLINANGAPAVEVANSAESTRAFADETRQAFSKVTGTYTDFSNGTTIIHTNVTLGAAHSLTIPITFSANVYLTYDLTTCQIYVVQAFATIPSVVAGQSVNPPILPSLIPKI